MCWKKENWKKFHEKLHLLKTISDLDEWFVWKWQPTVICVTLSHDYHMTVTWQAKEWRLLTVKLKPAAAPDTFPSRIMAPITPELKPEKFEKKM